MRSSRRRPFAARFGISSRSSRGAAPTPGRSLSGRTTTPPGRTRRTPLRRRPSCSKRPRFSRRSGRAGGSPSGASCSPSGTTERPVSLGSEAFVEQALRDRTPLPMAYVDVGPAAQGKEILARATPGLRDVIGAVLGAVPDSTSEKPVAGGKVAFSLPGFAGDAGTVHGPDDDPRRAAGLRRPAPSRPRSRSLRGDARDGPGPPVSLHGDRGRLPGDASEPRGAGDFVERLGLFAQEPPGRAGRLRGGGAPLGRGGTAAPTPLASEGAGGEPASRAGDGRLRAFGGRIGEPFRPRVAARRTGARERVPRGTSRQPRPGPSRPGFRRDPRRGLGADARSRAGAGAPPRRRLDRLRSGPAGASSAARHGREGGRLAPGARSRGVPRRRRGGMVGPSPVGSPRPAPS